jgi:hypothetical protein
VYRVLQEELILGCLWWVKVFEELQALEGDKYIG